VQDMCNRCVRAIAKFALVRWRLNESIAWVSYELKKIDYINKNNNRLVCWKRNIKIK